MPRNPTLLQVNSPSANLVSSSRTREAAVKRLRDNGEAHEHPSAPSLQALLDYCFDQKKSFDLHWNSATGDWVIRTQRKKAAQLQWEVEVRRDDQPVLLRTTVGRVSFALYQGDPNKAESYSWRLSMVGGGHHPLKAEALADAKDEAALAIHRILADAFQSLVGA